MVVIDEDSSMLRTGLAPPILLDINRLFQQPFDAVVNEVMVRIAAPIQPPLVVKCQFDALGPDTIGVVTASTPLHVERRGRDGQQ